jgi:uncharacterized protein (DUF1800 family)
VADPADIVHLLRRTEFVAKRARVEQLTPLPLEAAVDDVLAVAPWDVPAIPPHLQYDDEPRRWEQFRDAFHWWADLMVTRPRPIQEKMALFWHGHFVSALFDGVDRIQHMMRQIQIFRSYGLGSLVGLTHQVAIDPAMLLYLSNGNNVKAAPNDNWARELMELFTLGAGNYYTEADVVASARAWTGHNYDPATSSYVFVPEQHDNANKTFFGITRNWDGPEIIDHILRGDATARLLTAKFVSRKLWEFFAHARPAQHVVDDLAAVFVAHDLELKPLMRALLLRPEFYATETRQGLVRTPTDFAVAVMYHAHLTAAQVGLAGWSVKMGQILLNPPNVAGWKANEYWLSTSALSGRAGFARGATMHLRSNPRFDYLLQLAPDAAVDDVARFFGIAPLTAVTRDALIASHRAERDAQPDGWWAATNLLTMMMLTPEFNLA